MAITYHEESREFHIYNNQVSYIIQILRNDQLGQLYYGKKIKDRTSFGRMLQVQSRITDFKYKTHTIYGGKNS